MILCVWDTSVSTTGPRFSPVAGPQLWVLLPCTMSLQALDKKGSLRDCSHLPAACEPPGAVPAGTGRQGAAHPGAGQLQAEQRLPGAAGRAQARGMPLPSSLAKSPRLSQQQVPDSGCPCLAITKQRGRGTFPEQRTRVRRGNIRCPQASIWTGFPPMILLPSPDAGE